MPEAPELNVLIKQLNEILQNKIFFYKTNAIVNIFRVNKTICILLEHNKIITIHLMLKGFLSLARNKYTMHELKFSSKLKDITIFINDPMKLAKVKITANATSQYLENSSFVEFCKLHPNTMLKNILLKFEIGIGRYLLQDIFNNIKIDPNTKCKNIEISTLNDIIKYVNKLILHITSLHGKYTFKDLYGINGTYHPGGKV